MKYTIIADSCCDLKSADLNSDNIEFETTPLTITVGEKDYIDDESLDINDLLASFKTSRSAPKSACPSPELFAEAMRKGGDNIICVTLSSKLSGTYNSARLAAEMVKEESPSKNIFVLDSLSASSAMAYILNKLKELIESQKYSFEEIIREITEVRGKTKIRFLLQDLGNLIKTGRMSKIAGLIASVLTIKPICGDNGDGEIKMYAKALGSKKALMALGECPKEKVKEQGSDIPVVITHCNNEEDAGFLKTLLETKFGLSNIKTYVMRGVASFYANDKGLSLAY